MKCFASKIGDLLEIWRVSQSKQFPRSASISHHIYIEKFKRDWYLKIVAIFFFLGIFHSMLSISLFSGSANWCTHFFYRFISKRVWSIWFSTQRCVATNKAIFNRDRASVYILLRYEMLFLFMFRFHFLSFSSLQQSLVCVSFDWLYLLGTYHTHRHTHSHYPLPISIISYAISWYFSSLRFCETISDERLTTFIALV